VNTERPIYVILYEIYGYVDERFALISAASALIYTPGREHFGIVPIEAMALGTPVIAVASGGPLETVNQGATGFLCAQQPLDFANNMMRFVIDKNLSFNMAEACRRHVAQRFTSDVLRAHLQKSLERCLLIKDNDRSRFFVRKCAFNILRYFLPSL
jgi:glycosyltransferase involved in cell wall biosynthesis